MSAVGLPDEPGRAMADADPRPAEQATARVLRMTGVIAADGRGIECMDEVSDEDYARYERAAADLHAFAPHDTYGLVLRADQRFRTRCAAYGQRAAAGEMPVGWRTAFTDLIGELLSCLSAAELFLAHCDRQLGADPNSAPEREAFRAAWAAARAESFEFRVMEQLRGHVEGFGLPPGRVGTQLRLVPGAQRHGYAVTVELFRDELAATGFWGAAADELAQAPAAIDLGSCLAEMMRRLDAIMRAAMGERLALLAASAEDIAEIAGPALFRGGDAQIITLQLDAESDVIRRVGMQPVPVELVELVRARCAAAD